MARRGFWPSIDNPHPISARLAAAIIVDDFERNALTGFLVLSVGEVSGVNENRGVMIVRPDEPISASGVVIGNKSRWHLILSSVFRNRLGKCQPDLAIDPASRHQRCRWRRRTRLRRILELDVAGRHGAPL